MISIQPGDVGIWDEHHLGYCIMLFMEVDDQRMVVFTCDSFDISPVVQLLCRKSEGPEWNSKAQWVNSGWRFM